MSHIQDEVDKHDAITIDDVPRIIAEWAKQNLCPECGKPLRFSIGGGVNCSDNNNCRYWIWK